MRLSAYILVSLLLIAACRQGNTKKAPSVGEADSTIPVVKIFGTDTTGYGYSIFIQGKEIIHQPHIPAIDSLHSFSSKEDAERVALLVRQKMIDHQFPPAISVEEIDSLGVIY
jgi:uncharacterized protein DUF4907